MAFPLFWRLISGYAAILLLSVGASLYSIVQLGELSQTARAALETDYRTISHQETLTDAFLSEARYGGKYLITQSPASYDQFRQFKSDFMRYLGALKSAGVSGEIPSQLVRVEQLHHSYHDLFEQEVRYLKAGQSYAQSRYQQERDKILENTLRELGRLKDQLEKNVHDKLQHMDGAARAARGIAIATTLILLVLGTALSLKISTSITRPLLALKTSAQDASSNQVLGRRLSPIPEIQELSEVLARQKQQMHQIAENNASHIERLTEQLAARLTSFKRQLIELKAEKETTISAQGRASVDTLIGDTDRMVQDCAEANASAAARMEVMKLRPQTPLQLKVDPATLGTNDWIMRELPDAPTIAQGARERIVARCASIFAPLARQLRLPKSDTHNHDT